MTRACLKVKMFLIFGKGADRSRKNPLFWRPHDKESRVSMLQGDWKMHMIDGETVPLQPVGQPGRRRKCGG